MLILSLSGCITGDSGSHNPKLESTISVAFLRFGDNLTIDLQSIPDPLSLDAQVDDQGFISLRYIGKIKAVDLTASELASKIKQTYLDKKIYTDIDISVTLADRFVYVGGEVRQPGRVPWSTDLTMTKAITLAGEFGLYAKKDGVILNRDNGSYTFDAKLALRKPIEDPKLLPGDRISVPRSTF